MDPRLKAALGAAIALLYLVLRFKGLGYTEQRGAHRF